MVSGDSGCHFIFFSLLPAHSHHSGVTQFLPTGGEKEKNIKNVTAPTSRCEYWHDLGRSRRQGSGPMPLGSCGRLVFQRAKHTLTKPGLISLYQNQSYLALQEAIISVL